jgi:hypothetical protein
MKIAHERRLYLLSDLLLWTTPDLSFRGFMPINEGTAVEGVEEGGRLLIKVACGRRRAAPI